jgi:hypothetical protein
MEVAPIGGAHTHTLEGTMQYTPVMTNGLKWVKLGEKDFAITGPADELKAAAATGTATIVKVTVVPVGDVEKLADGTFIVRKAKATTKADLLDEVAELRAQLAAMTKTTTRTRR